MHPSARFAKDLWRNGRSILLFEGADREQLAALGDVRTPSIADLFVAVIGAAR